MGPEFFQTVMGHKFYEADVPRIARALESIAVEMKRANDLEERDRESRAKTVKEVTDEFRPGKNDGD